MRCPLADVARDFRTLLSLLTPRVAVGTSRPSARTGNPDVVIKRIASCICAIGAGSEVTRVDPSSRAGPGSVAHAFDLGVAAPGPTRVRRPPLGDQRCRDHVMTRGSSARVTLRDHRRAPTACIEARHRGVIATVERPAGRSSSYGCRSIGFDRRSDPGDLVVDVLVAGSSGFAINRSNAFRRA